MKIYRVGGSVRDTLLGLPITDIDYVVVGSTPEQMVAAGFIPVGKDFPVFIHPTTRAEYALARTERKSAPGYHGFVFHCAPDVTIEEDLERRDLTINAMAILDTDPLQNIIDPFGGQQNLAAKIFRHVSPAFAEDPVRILRVARFAARFNTFTVAPETLQLMCAMVENGEVDALVPERVWQEIARGLMEQQPSRMIAVLRQAQALPHILPEIDSILINSNNEARMQRAIDYAAQLGFSLAVRWAAMLGAGVLTDAVSSSPLLITQLCTRLKVPVEVRDITRLVLQKYTEVKHALSLSPEVVVRLFEYCDAFRRPTRLTQLIEAVLCLQDKPSPFPQQAYLEQALVAAQAVLGREIAQTTQLHYPNQPQQIAKAIFAARVEAIKHMQ